MNISKARSYKEEEENKSFRVAELFLLLSSTMKTLVLIALVGCSLGILMKAVVAEKPFETAESLEDEEEGYEGNHEDANAPDFSDSDEEEKGRYEERMNTPGDSDDDHKEEKERNEQRMNDVTDGEDEVLEKPEDAVDDPDR